MEEETPHKKICVRVNVSLFTRIEPRNDSGGNCKVQGLCAGVGGAQCQGQTGTQQRMNEKNGLSRSICSRFWILDHIINHIIITGHQVANEIVGVVKRKERPLCHGTSQIL